MDIIQGMRDKTLFARWFEKNWRGVDTWKAWRAFLAVLFALPLDADSYELYRKFTVRSDVPLSQASEAWLVSAVVQGGAESPPSSPCFSRSSKTTRKSWRPARSEP